MLDHIVVDGAVYALRPDFAVLLIVAEGLANGPSEETYGPAAVPGDEVVSGPADQPVPVAGDDPVPAAGVHVAAWREAYRGFGVNPRRARPSVEALLRRAEPPRINRVVDAYNAISVRHELPIGGEDLDAYEGHARLVRAAGDEPFATVKDGAPVIEYPEPGEVVWRDDAGVTCRRWNWRQCSRTHITEQTKNALFILERLEPYPLDRLVAAGADLAAMLRAISPDVAIGTRLIAP